MCNQYPHKYVNLNIWATLSIKDIFLSLPCNFLQSLKLLFALNSPSTFKKSGQGIKWTQTVYYSQMY